MALPSTSWSVKKGLEHGHHRVSESRFASTTMPRPQTGVLIWKLRALTPFLMPHGGYLHPLDMLAGKPLSLNAKSGREQHEDVPFEDSQVETRELSRSQSSNPCH